MLAKMMRAASDRVSHQAGPTHSPVGYNDYLRAKSFEAVMIDPARGPLALSAPARVTKRKMLPVPA